MSQATVSAKDLVGKLKEELQGLEEAIEAKTAEREEIRSQLRDLVGTNGDGASAPRPGRKKGKTGPRGPRAKNEGSLGDFIENALKKTTKGLQVQDLAKKILDSGYKTNSNKEGFAQTVYQTLRKMVRDGKLECSEDKKYTIAA